MPIQNKPFVCEEQPGRKAWCACGESEKKPYCDGSHARFARCVLARVQLTAATLRGTTFVDVRFADCELSGADLHDASLKRVEFHNCRMTGINVSDAELRHVRDHANCMWSTCQSAWGADQQVSTMGRNALTCVATITSSPPDMPHRAPAGLSFLGFES